MTCYMIKLRYDGTNYAGYQKQANANTVGEEVLNALTTLFGSVEKLSGCSRTDSGVHANCYCASFHSEKNIEPQKVIRGLNGILPRDIAVFDCAEVSPDFHARYSVKAKEYIYLILNSSVRDPFYEKYALSRHCTVLRIDTNAINSAARRLYAKLGYREADIVPCAFNGIPDVNLVLLEKKLK